MTLTAAIEIATSGLLNIGQQYNTLSQNVANSGTPNYALEVGQQSALSAAGQGFGVRRGPAVLQVDQALNNQVAAQASLVSKLQTINTALGSVNNALGVVTSPNSVQNASPNDLPNLLGQLQSAFSTLEANPGNQAQQNQVVTAAQNVVGAINNLANTYTTVRQTAQNDLVTSIATLNTAAATISALNTKIVQLQATGQSVADLQNQRATAMATVSKLTGVTFEQQGNGAVQAYTTGGVSLPLNGTLTFSIANATIGASSSYADGTAPAILLGGTDVTRGMTGGQIGADITLRDSTMPTYQAELDEFAYTLSSRFSNQGLNLFTQPDGSLPQAGASPAYPQQNYVGFGGTITVNPAVVAAPAQVRDGNTSIPLGSTTGAAGFTPNPATGPAGYTTLISNILTYAFGPNASDTNPQPAMNVSNLGIDANLQASYAPQNTLADAAATVIAAQAQDIAANSNSLTSEQAVQTALTTQQGTISGISIDQQMSLMIQLQNAYAANARIISAMQQMWNDLVNQTSTPVA